MFFSIIFISLALILYTVAIWSEKLKKELKPWMIGIFVIAFTCDLLGTGIMSILAGKHNFNLHILCGRSALVIMFLHLCWALIAFYKHGQCQKLFHRFSIYAWLIWLFAFFSGIPK